jgi:TonB family protein
VRNSVLVFIAACVSTAAFAQSAVDTSADLGSVHDGVYTNQFLGISWDLPNGWSVDDRAAVGENRQTLLRLLPGGRESIELAEVRYGKDEDSEKIASDLKAKGWEAVGKAAYVTLGGGIVGLRFDFRLGGPPEKYLTIFVAERRGEHLVFSLTASSPGRLGELVHGVLQIRVQPDWGLAEEPIGVGSASKRVRISQGVSQTLLKEKVQPKYPREALKQGVQGEVLMLAHISTEGTVKNLYVLSGSPLLQQAAVDAVSQWTYRPYLLQGSPVEVETQITVNFVLR